MSALRAGRRGDRLGLMDTRRFVIVGAALAGAKAATALREEGFEGRVVLIGSEDELPYERPPLSKSYLQGKSTLADAQVHNSVWYDDNSVDLRLATTVAAVRPGAHEIELAGGETIGYGALLLATGSTPRRLPVPGADAAGILTLRRVEDSDAIRETFGADRRLAIIGGGWIGLEVAAAAREAGTEVTVIEATAAPLLAVLGPDLAAVFATLHTDHGVTLYTEARVAEILTTDGRASGVRLADGTVIPADAVVVGIGAAPNTELAEQAGLAVDNGVLVSAALRSSDPDIYAVGDIANAEHPFVGTRIRVEHWANALNQPAVAAGAMLGNDVSYDALPYFYTDQYDLGMEYVGHAPPGSYSQVVVRGDLPAREFVAFWLDAESRVLAGMNVNVWDVTDPIKALIRSRNAMTASLLADPTVLLEDLA